MNLQVLRATELWQQAGAYSVRIQGMARQHNITLRDEFDGHDTPETKYIVVLDENYPVATCRWYPLSETTAMIGRVVVLPDYRGKGLGKQVMLAAEQWLRELGFTAAGLESRLEAVGFYEKLGYRICSGNEIHGVTFTCVPMEKAL